MSKSYVSEPLEKRVLLSLTIFGTPGDDTIILAVSGNIISGHTIHATVNGVTTDYNDNNNLFINCGDGNDQVQVHTLGGENLEVDAGHGDDTLTVGLGDFTSDINGTIAFASSALDNGGNDSLIIDDSFGEGTTYDVDTQMVSGEEVFGSAKVTWDGGIESKLLEGSEHADSYNIYGLQAGTTINGGRGDDVFTLGADDHAIQKQLCHGTDTADYGADDGDTLRAWRLGERRWC